MIGRAWAPLLAACMAAGAVASCSVDDRDLSASAGSSGSSSFGGADAVGGHLLDAAGDGGQSDHPMPLPICDYGSGVASGCATLVDNPGFTKDTFSWSAEDATVSMSWSDTDATSNQHSGSIAVVNSLFGDAKGTASRGATQCLPTRSRQAYAFAVDIFIPEGQGDGPNGETYTGNAGLSVIFFTSGQCDDYTLFSATSAVLEQAGSWGHREGKAVAPEGAQSMLVRLVTFKDFREYSFEARFDNVLLKVE